MTKHITHSYSATNNFNTCNLRYKGENYLKSYKSEPHPAAERGVVIHEEFEQCVKDDTDYSIKAYQWVLDRFRARTGLKIPEMKLAIGLDWAPCDYKDADAFYRGAIDFTCLNGTHADVDDLKTGKRKMKKPAPYETWLLDRHTTGMENAPQMLSNARQASEYTLMLAHHYTHIKTIDFRFVWSDVDGITEDLFHFDLERDKQNLHDTMLATPTKIQWAIDSDTWEPNPSGLCHQYCPVASCQYNGKRWSEIKKLLRR